MFLEALERPFPLTLLLLECLTDESHKAQEEGNDPPFSDVAARAWARAGRSKSLSPDDIQYLAERLEALANESGDADDSEPAEPTESGNEKGLGTALSQWIEGLDNEQICLYVAAWDHEKARQLYCEVDRNDVRAMFTQRVEYEYEQLRANFEASMFGFGGNYGDGEDGGDSPEGGVSGKVVEFDLTRGGEDGLTNMKDMLKL